MFKDRKLVENGLNSHDQVEYCFKLFPQGRKQRDIYEPEVLLWVCVTRLIFVRHEHALIDLIFPGVSD